MRDTRSIRGTSRTLEGLAVCMRALARSLRGDGGQVAVIVPVFMVFFMIAGVLVIDVGMMMNDRRQAQAAADFAALAAAMELPFRSGDPQESQKLIAAEDMALRYLRANRYAPEDAGVAVRVTTSYGGEPDKVEVAVSRQYAWVFGNFFGLIGATHVGARAVAHTNAQPRDIVVVLDHSGSMCLASHGGPWNDCPSPGSRDLDRNGIADWQPFDTMRAAAKNFSSHFTPTVSGVTVDRLGLVVFSTSASTVLPLTTNFVGPTSGYATEINRMVPQGTTNIGYGIARARQELAARARPEALKIIVVLTDGYANLYRSGGTETDPRFSFCWSSYGCTAADTYTKTEAQRAADAGAAIYTIGLTSLAGAELLQDVAEIGARGAGQGGQYFDVDDPNDLNETFREIADLVRIALLE